MTTFQRFIHQIRVEFRSFNPKTDLCTKDSSYILTESLRMQRLPKKKNHINHQNLPEKIEYQFKLYTSEKHNLNHNKSSQSTEFKTQNPSEESVNLFKMYLQIKNKILKV